MDVKRHIRPGNGAADISRLLHDRALFRQVVDALAEAVASVGVDKVACIEGRGFLLGSAVAYRLGAGLVPLRHAGRLKSAVPIVSVEFVDYSRTPKRLELQCDGVAPAERVVIVDDWVETGATMLAALALIERCGGAVAGISVLIDDTQPAMRAVLARHNYHYLARTEPGDAF